MVCYQTRKSCSSSLSPPEAVERVLSLFQALSCIMSFTQTPIVAKILHSSAIPPGLSLNVAWNLTNLPSMASPLSKHLPKIEYPITRLLVQWLRRLLLRTFQIRRVAELPSISIPHAYHFINQPRGGGKCVTTDSGYGQAIGQCALAFDSNRTSVFHGFRETGHAFFFNVLTASDTPAIKPPPPTGTTIASASGTSSNISSPTDIVQYMYKTIIFILVLLGYISGAAKKSIVNNFKLFNNNIFYESQSSEVNAISRQYGNIRAHVTTLNERSSVGVRECGDRYFRCARLHNVSQR
ncbi:hypothetical protein AGLY_015536 [Aphis glycines]|uniref:Uncharacterized protein n=1 Tax=Aphis glycines TaxID=307491 RepID=A0A6G0T128_APHGL|nr:hypothetical protein AGLY_015536 [Aphis glycines]